MKSLFFRTYLSVIAFALITFSLIVYLVLNPALEREEWEIVQFELEEDYELIYEYLKAAPAAQWPALVEAQQEEIYKVATLIDLADVASAEHKTILTRSEQARIISELHENPWYGKFRVPDSDKVVVITDETPMLVGQEDSSLHADENRGWGLLEYFSLMTASEKIETFAPLILVSLAQLFGVIILVRLIKKPIDQLTKSAQELGGGDFSVRADANAPEPLGGLATGFNSMAQQIQQSMQEKEILIAAIPHELQTPLSRMRFLLELSHKKKNVEQLRNTIADLDENLSELELAVQEVLQLTKIKNADSSHMNSVALLDLLEPIAQYYNKSDTLEVLVSCEPELCASAHPELLNRAVRNLVQNAEKYAHSKCRVSALVQNNTAVIIVEDDGLGIPADMREHMLTAFARLDSSRSSNTGGLGLGLALVKTVMDLHGGTATIGESPLGGASIQLRWPQSRTT